MSKDNSTAVLIVGGLLAYAWYKNSLLGRAVDTVSDIASIVPNAIGSVLDGTASNYANSPAKALVDSAYSQPTAQKQIEKATSSPYVSSGAVPFSFRPEGVGVNTAVQKEVVPIVPEYGTNVFLSLATQSSQPFTTGSKLQSQPVPLASSVAPASSSAKKVTPVTTSSTVTVYKDNNGKPIYVRG